MTDKAMTILMPCIIIWFIGMITYQAIEYNKKSKPEYSIELLKSSKIKVNGQVMKLDSLEEYIEKDSQ